MQTFFDSEMMLNLQLLHNRLPILSQQQQWCGAINDNALLIIVIFTFITTLQLIILQSLVIMW